MVELARRKRGFFAEALWTFYLPKFDVLRQLLEAKAVGIAFSAAGLLE